MSQNFKLKFDEMRQGNPAEGIEDNAAYQNYDTASHVRNICFEWPDGRVKFLNYAYLVSGEFDPIEGFITLIFTSESVKMQGVKLRNLFTQIVNHIPKVVIVTDPRYSQILSTDDFIVTNIEISKS